MSPPSHQSSGASVSREPVARPRRRWGRPSVQIVVWLTVVWVFLWGEISLWNILMGIVLAVSVTVVMPLPAAVMRWTVRPWAVIRLGVIFIKDLITAAVQVSMMLLKGYQPTGGVISVRMRSHSDLFLSTTAGMISLVPGTVVVDAHRVTGTLYLHVLNAHAPGGMQKAYDAALAQEERVLRAFAPDDMLIDAGYRPGATPRAGRVDARTGEELEPKAGEDT